ncbi:predicted protein [Naegleria gruberi]|uniref:Predicted protein n=1 Tax=Naegleria gruberi TaxID=5762 RepID=D2VJ49_NAEGR|nr:uncharacterized protein NAEGRDRAFT_68907 [Naegleria gruberi]EFC43136.1 predicted protein [Naegleria gruberi]|eukprot:XP_002675880.1 predicted protein [Naegleria gruberi strain NEG-M]
MKLKQSSTSHWYETCGEAFFTQLLIPFLHNPSQELKSLSQTCQFIYQTYSQHFDNYWKRLLLNKYCDFQKGTLDSEKLKGKLMMLYYQLEYFENHLEKLPESLISTSGPIGTDSKYGVYRPCFISSSSYGYGYGQGFCTMLTSSFFSEDYDPRISIDDYSYNLEMDDLLIQRRNISLFPAVVYEEYSALVDSYIQRSDGIIFTLVFYREFHPFNVKAEMESFSGFYKRVANDSDLLNRYIFTIAMHFKENIPESERNDLEEELRKYIAENYCFKNYLIIKCNLSNREQVLKTVRETVKRYRCINVNLFLKHFMKSEKKCLLM